MSLKISVADLKNLKLTNFFHYFLKANFKKISYEPILADFGYVFLTILSNEWYQQVLIPVVYFFFHIKIQFYLTAVGHPHFPELKEL